MPTGDQSNASHVQLAGWIENPRNAQTLKTHTLKEVVAKQEHWKTGLLTKAIFGWNSANTSFVEEFESTDDDEEELINEKCSSTRLMSYPDSDAATEIKNLNIPIMTLLNFSSASPSYLLKRAAYFFTSGACPDVFKT
eukprot:scaffold1931_cov281-Chaetoceros_neogracile.AAC.9